MPESVPLRCPACRREHRYRATSYPCACGAPVTPPLDPAAEPVVIVHRVWAEEWVTLRCGSCGREDQWPRPELGCPCGAALRVRVREPEETAAELDADVRATELDADVLTPELDTNARTTKLDADARSEQPDVNAPDLRDPSDAMAASDASDVSDALNASEATAASETSASPTAPITPAAPTAPDGTRAHAPGPAADGSPGDSPGGGPGGSPEGPPPRRAFHPVTIRTARDAVTTAALYLRWLGYRDIRRADQRPPSGIGLAARGLLAQVDPTMHPASPRDVECLWLTAMTESADCVYFSLAGYADDARERADDLGVPLFVLALSGTPRPVNGPADALGATGT